MSARTPGEPGGHITEQGDNHGSEERNEACGKTREISSSGEAGRCSCCTQEEGSSHQCGEGCPCRSGPGLMRGEEGRQEEIGLPKGEIGLPGGPKGAEVVWWMLAGIYIALANVQGIALILFLYVGATAGWDVIPVAPLLCLFLIWLSTSGWMIVNLAWRLGQ